MYDHDKSQSSSFVASDSKVIASHHHYDEKEKLLASLVKEDWKDEELQLHHHLHLECHASLLPASACDDRCVDRHSNTPPDRDVASKAQARRSLLHVFRIVLGCLLVLAFNYLYIDRPVPMDDAQRDNDDMICAPDLPAPLQEHVPVHFNHSLHNLFEGDALMAERTDAAVCKFVKTFETMHYPHAMEQIYNCFTWFRRHPDKPWVMVYPPGHPGFHDHLPRGIVTKVYSKFTPAAGDSTFLTGFTEAMGDVFNITFTTEDVGPSVQQKLYINTHRYFIMKPSDLRELTDGVLSYHDIPRADCNGGSTMPRIGILNRQKQFKRSILNVDQIAHALQSAFNYSAPIPIHTLEDASFAEQLEFFALHDIVLAPHGAALTAVPFMPQCGAFLEVFPKHFFMPHYFGSLAESSDLKQYFMYESLGDGAEESGHMYQMLQGKRTNLCLDADHIVSAVQKMVVDWQTCCHRNAVR